MKPLIASRVNRQRFAARCASPSVFRDAQPFSPGAQGCRAPLILRRKVIPVKFPRSGRAQGVFCLHAEMSVNYTAGS